MKNNAHQIIKILRDRGERITPARHKLVELFFYSKKPLSAAELSIGLKKAKIKSDKTTIYRQLEDLLLHGVLEEVRFEDRVKRYELSVGQHHHHLVCVGCGKVEDIEVKENFEQQEKIIARTKKFKVDRHSLEFFGRCRKCKK